MLILSIVVDHNLAVLIKMQFVQLKADDVTYIERDQAIHLLYAHTHLKSLDLLHTNECCHSFHHSKTLNE